MLTRVALAGTMALVVGFLGLAAFYPADAAWSLIPTVPLMVQALVLASVTTRRFLAVEGLPFRILRPVVLGWCALSAAVMVHGERTAYRHHGYLGWRRDGEELTTTLGFGVTGGDLLVFGLATAVQVASLVVLWRRRPLQTAEDTRLFAGFVVQPLAATVLAFLAFPLIDPGGLPIYLMARKISIALDAGFAAFLVTLFFGFPLVVWLSNRGPLRLKQILACGAILGNVPYAIVGLLAVTAVTRDADAAATWFGPLAIARALAIGTIFGMAGGALFWVISIRGPIRSGPSSE